ncbi:MAG: hypothetical protein MW690_000881 [Methanophagales archaeon]|nr:hypothetical protein [Methanophagales archaeon]
MYRCHKCQNHKFYIVNFLDLMARGEDKGEKGGILPILMFSLPFLALVGTASAAGGGATCTKIK